MAQSRADKIYLAYKVTRAAFTREGITDRVHGRTLLYLAEVFGVNPLAIQKIINDRK